MNEFRLFLNDYLHPLQICIEMRLKTILLILLLFCSKLSIGQSGVRDSIIHFVYTGISYGVYAPGGDLDERFGTASILGMDLHYKSDKNWIFGFSGGFIFGGDVKEQGLFDDISTASGQIIGLDGLFADVRVFERGYQVGVTVGKLINFQRPNPNSGIVVSATGGFVQHKIKIDAIGNTVPQLRNDYKKGYDHLTNGFQLTEYIGYNYFSNRQLVNFYGGFEFMQGFTSNRRDFNFNNMEGNDKNRLDLRYGFKLGWILPLYKKKPAPFYLY